MQSYQTKAQVEHKTTSNLLPALAIGSCAFVVGIGLTYGYVKWSAQQEKLAQMSRLIEEIRQQPAPVSAAASADPVAFSQDVTRGETVDLVSLSSSAVMAEPAPTPAAVAEPAAQAPAPAPTPQVATVPAQSTAEKLRNLVSTALETPPSASTAPTISIDDETLAKARRLETLAIVHAGVEELVAAVVEGNYDIHTNYEDETFSGRIHFAFVGHEEDQKELEGFLATAAENGIIAHSKSVVDGDGSVNGHILLFELVERALENGTLEEQEAVAKMRREAVALLAKDDVIAQSVTTSGERYYTVVAGDSLAYISLQFYGNTNGYERIFQANRSKLRTPDRIRVGQRLLIPST